MPYCEDTPGWNNGYDGGDYTCNIYEENGWCKDGDLVLESSFTLLKDPASNCCACGKSPYPTNESLCIIGRPPKCDNPPTSPLRAEGGGTMPESSLYTSWWNGGPKFWGQGCRSAQFWQNDLGILRPSQSICRGENILSKNSKLVSPTNPEGYVNPLAVNETGGSPFMTQDIDYEWYRDCCQWGFSQCIEKECGVKIEKQTVLCARDLDLNGDYTEIDGQPADPINPRPLEFPGSEHKISQFIIVENDNKEIRPGYTAAGTYADFQFRLAPGQGKPIFRDECIINKSCPNIKICLEYCEKDPSCQSFDFDPGWKDQLPMMCKLYSKRMYENTHERDVCVPVTDEELKDLSQNQCGDDDEAFKTAANAVKTDQGPLTNENGTLYFDHCNYELNNGGLGSAGLCGTCAEALNDQLCDEAVRTDNWYLAQHCCGTCGDELTHAFDAKMNKLSECEYSTEDSLCDMMNRTIGVWVDIYRDV